MNALERKGLDLLMRFVGYTALQDMSRTMAMETMIAATPDVEEALHSAADWMKKQLKIDAKRRKKRGKYRRSR